MPEKPENIVFLLSDAVRQDHVGCYGSEDVDTPNIDRLAEQGTVFENAYAVTNATDPSLTSIFSGRHPHSLGMWPVHGPQIGEDERRILDGITTFPELINDEYDTVAIDWLGRWHRKGFTTYDDMKDRATFTGVDQNKERKFKDLLKYKTPEPVYRHVRRIHRLKRMGDKGPKTDTADEIVDRALDHLESDRKTFLFAHFWDTHGPYYAGGGGPMHDASFLDHLLRPEEILRQQYIQSIEYVDHQIGRLIDSLEEQGELENTLIVFLSDHGESLTEHGIYFEHHGLYEPSVRVPLVASGPGFPKAERVQEKVQLVDLFPTVLDITGKDAEGRTHNGRSLLETIKGGEGHETVFFAEAVSQRKEGLSDGRHKLIVAEDEESAVCRYCGTNHADGLIELYDLENDPGEEENLVPSSPETVAEMQDRLASKKQGMEGMGIDGLDI